MSKTWFITGASRGFGRAWTLAALRRGDRVAATARDPASLADLVDQFGDAILPLSLDVTDRDADIAAVRAAHAAFGRLDVVVNNAGYGHFGFVEELAEDEIRAQLETNFFGALWVTQAAIPLLRMQGGGHILQVSSIGGILAAPSLSAYNASKWALEGLSEALAQEVAPAGIKVTIIEPGAFATDWATTSAAHSTPLPSYEPFRERISAMRAGRSMPDAGASAAAVFAVVDSEHPPLRLILGGDGYDRIPAVYADRLRVWGDWERVSRAGSSPQ